MPRMRRRPVLAVLVALACLAVAACGDDDDPVAATTAATAPPATTTAAADDGRLCTDLEEPNGRDRTVADLPADDPDGGLVVHADAGTGAPQIGVLPSGTAVITTNDPATCVVLADGGIWWKVQAPDGLRGWVNSRLLTVSADQERVSRVEICRLYDEVLEYESASGDFAPAPLTAELTALLDAPPVGVSDALGRISSPADEADLADAYASLRAYVGPICPPA